MPHLQVQAIVGYKKLEASDCFRNGGKQCLVGPNLRLFGDLGDVNIAEMDVEMDV
jgi:hypothetical protein